MNSNEQTDPRGPTRRDVEQFMRDELLESLPATYDRSALLAATRAMYVINQTVAYDYSKPVGDLHQRLVVLPRRRHADQRRVAHQLSVVGADPRSLTTRTDRFGNTVVSASVPRVRERIEFNTRAVVLRSTTGATASPWRAAEPTSTPLTAADEALHDAAHSIGPARDVFDTADALADMIRSSFEYAHDVTSVRTTAAEAWALRTGLCQDMAHVMIAMSSSLGIAARYVSGHLVGDGASHAWVEVYDPNRQAVLSVDPTHRRRTDLRYITTATGRDYRDVAPTSGTYSGRGSRGTLRVTKIIRLADLA